MSKYKIRQLVDGENIIIRIGQQLELEGCNLNHIVIYDSSGKKFLIVLDKEI